MNCIIVDDEPLAREAIQSLVEGVSDLQLLQQFSNARSAQKFIEETPVDLIFLDVQMPGLNGISFAKQITGSTLIIFTTAYSQFALDGFELDAVDYLIKPISEERFQRAVIKARSYLSLLKSDISANKIETIDDHYVFVKEGRKYIKVDLRSILFIQGLKDYVIMQTEDGKIITPMNLKTIHDQLPKNIFVRVSKSYVINVQHVKSFDNNSVTIRDAEMPIGDFYRKFFFDEFVKKKLIGRLI
ncbi:response regulator transcription factor [Pedobacter antarcticus]|uniref:LytR/AlgR family response regulator transcription factor n=1 Tax=Pedobacter antarcticus TaxID=34086 RepID=UPI002930A86B|nr:response regulator transcription factor [Pedobacter antarcticus]